MVTRLVFCINYDFVSCVKNVRRIILSNFRFHFPELKSETVIASTGGHLALHHTNLDCAAFHDDSFFHRPPPQIVSESFFFRPRKEFRKYRFPYISF